MKQIKLTPDRIEVYFPYSAGMVKKIKEIPGSRFDGIDKCWWFPKYPIYAKALVQIGNDHGFSIDMGLFKLAQHVDTKREIDRTPLYFYQKDGVDFLHTNNGTCILSDELGLGKTIEALWYSKEASIKRMLVVCPASVIYKWKAEAERWGGYSAKVIATTKTEIPLDTNVIIMSYAILLNKIKSGGELPKMFWELIIADEAHHLKDKDAKTTLAFCKLMGARRLFLTGTPLLNRPIELFSLLNQINPSKWNNYYVFAHRYCNAHQVEIYGRGGKKIKYLDVSGSSNLDELREELKPIMLRRLKQDVISELPDLSRVVVPLDITNRSDYNKAHKDFKAWLLENGRHVTPNALSQLNYLRQLVGHGKVKATVDLAEDIMQSDSNRKLVIYAHHKEVIKKLKLELKKYGVATIVGDDSPKEREASIQAFQNKILPRIMLISEAGGEGVDLFRADTIIFTERAWNGSKENQAEARLHRIGQKNAVTAYYLVARKTIDEKIHELVEAKRDIFDAVIGDASIYQEIMEMFE